MPLGFGFGIGTRNYNDISDDDESDDGGYAIAPLAGAAHYRETASRGAVTVTRGGAAPVIRHQPPSLAAAASPEPPSAVRVTRGGAAPVRCLGGVIARMEPETLMRSTPELIPGLVEAFNSPSADVRKAVVDTLVSMYDSLGDWLLPQLSGLSPAQQKLVTIYINRAMEKNGGGGGKVAAKAGAMSADNWVSHWQAGKA